MTSVWGDSYGCSTQTPNKTYMARNISRYPVNWCNFCIFIYQFKKIDVKKKAKLQFTLTLSASCLPLGPTLLVHAGLCWCVRLGSLSTVVDTQPTRSHLFSSQEWWGGWVLTSTSRQHGGSGRASRDRLETTPVSCAKILIKYLQRDLSWAFGTPPSKSWKPHYKSKHILSDFYMASPCQPLPGCMCFVKFCIILTDPQPWCLIPFSFVSHLL